MNAFVAALLAFGRSKPSGTKDYNELINKPRLNGKLLMGDVTLEEDDPTIPSWAKQQNPPSAESIGAISEENSMKDADIEAMFKDLE